MKAIKNDNMPFYPAKYTADICQAKTFLAAVAADVFIACRKWIASVKLLFIQLLTTKVLLCYIINRPHINLSYLLL